MSPGARGFLRENAFLVAAVSLPVVVVGFFLLSAIIPRWLVPPPSYDLLLSTSSYDQASPRVMLEITVQGERALATMRAAAPGNSYPPRATLWLFDHRTSNVRQIPIEIPDRFDQGELPRTIAIPALAGRRVLTQTKAPDGYAIQDRTHSSPGLIGDLFGMHRYDHSLSLVNRGRVVAIAIPSPYEYQSPTFVGWLIDEGRR